jgi:hypothetical protein
MKNRTLLAAIATAAVVAIAAPSTSHAQVPQTSKGEVATLPSFGSLISAINSSSAQAEKLKGLTTLTAENVQFVDVAELVKGNSEEALTNALEKNKADIETLRGTLGATSPLGTVITANTALELKPEHVIATDVGADGKVVVYYWKKTS